jgi:hypothetical protein
MYEVDGDDRATELEGIPQSAVGAPLPAVLSDEHTVIVAYLMEDPDNADESVVLVTFAGYRALFFGPPNDEALAGHPLADRGLRPYGSFVVEPSSWVRRLQRMNSVHPRHDPRRFDALRHFVLTFHDSTFECVAPSFAVETHAGSIRAVIPRMADLLSDTP